MYHSIHLTDFEKGFGKKKDKCQKQTFSFVLRFDVVKKCPSALELRLIAQSFLLLSVFIPSALGFHPFALCFYGFLRSKKLCAKRKAQDGVRLIAQSAKSHKVQNRTKCKIAQSAKGKASLFIYKKAKKP
jgi:hypothetical protein